MESNITEGRQPENKGKETPSPRGGMGWIIGLVAVVAVIVGLVVWNPGGVFDAIKGGASDVASVNGIVITRAELSDRIARVEASIEAQGGSVTDDNTKDQLTKQVLTTLVNEELLLQAAAASSISLADDEVESQLAEIRGRFATEDEYQNELTSSKFTQKTFRENVRRQIVIQKYLAQRIDERVVSVTEEEIVQVYQQAADAATGDVPTLDQVRDQLAAQIQQQKLNSALKPIIAELRAAADIQLFI